MNRLLNARCEYSAAPAADGYLPTSSRYDVAVSIATRNAPPNASQAAPPTRARDVARQRIDARAEHVADHEEQ